ncbi:MAG: integrase arm-type DNA-binding domain-containing protein [Sphingomonadales bacterium]|nr:integrase arm-type DNA-binding domain-containing protein [Sphingomonadales bacterium]MDE2168765.1 integrase arm-type DNA-binding domain-containing protein [Sphingomonadales bacterium]
MGKLTVTKIRNAKPGYHANGRAKAVRLSDGAGLHLLVKATGGKSWVLRVQVDGKSRDIGLGTVDLEGGNRAFGAHDPLTDIPLMLRTSLTLAEAREKAAALRKLAKAGADPVVERDKERRKAPTFSEVVTIAHEALKSGWADRTAKAFLASLEEHANPKLGPMRVDAVGASDIILALAPIWNDKPVMARKVRARVFQVLAFAKARGWRTDSLPDAREMKSGLSKQARGDNFAAMPFAEVPDFVKDQLALEAGASRMAMLFAILTAARSGEVRQAQWSQIDLEARTWTRPAGMMKMGIAHVVTLSDAAVALLERMTPDEKLRQGLIFPGAKAGKPLSDMSLTKIMRLASRSETVHGFRSAFRDWAAEKMPTIPAMVAEMALAHRVGTATEQAYLRSDLRDMRRALMDGWGRFVAPGLSGTGDNVVPLQRTSK